jgi:hypothetical protein
MKLVQGGCPSKARIINYSLYSRTDLRMFLLFWMGDSQKCRLKLIKMGGWCEWRRIENYFEADLRVTTVNH